MPRLGTVVLVHGLWLHGVVLHVMRRRLERRGYDVLTYSYPTVRLDLRANGERLSRFCEQHNRGKLHFIAHSMGGLVTLNAARRLPAARVGRIVTLGTPYQDSYAARAVQRLPGGRSIIGRCMGEWLAHAGPRERTSFDLGVIAGTGRVGLGQLVAPGLPKPNDGVVTVDETRVAGMRDHVVVRVSHTFMIISRAVLHQACTYLEHGQFDHTHPAVVSLN